MNKPEVTESGLPISGLLRQAIAFVRDFAAFAGPRGVMASVLAVLAASFDGVGLLLLVPLLSLITASETGTGWMHEFLMQAFDMAGAQSRWRPSTFEPLVARLGGPERLHLRQAGVSGESLRIRPRTGDLDEARHCSRGVFGAFSDDMFVRLPGRDGTNALRRPVRAPGAVTPRPRYAPDIGKPNAAARA